MNRIITIGREFGSGGRELGYRIAEKLQIAYYDQEIITEIAKRTALPEDYIRQIKNPYCYLSNGVIVKISFAGRDTLEECLSRCIMSEKKL